jgi:hypothetical protein
VGDDDSDVYHPIAALDPLEVEDARDFCVQETNRYRTMLALPALVRSTEMEAYADEGAAIDAYSEGPHQHFTTVPFTGHRTLRLIIQRGWALFWGEGPGGGHYDNMISDFTDMGCGFHLDVPMQTVTVVQDFRKR